MNIRFANIFKDTMLFWIFLTTGLLIVVTFLSIVLTYASYPPFIPLYNQRPWGQARLGSQEAMFLPLGIAFVFFCINFFMAVKTHKNIVLLSRILLFTSFLIALLAFLFTVRTIHIII